MSPASGPRVPTNSDSTDTRPEQRYQLQVLKNLRRNYLAHLFHGMLGATGFRLINAPTFLPAYIMLLSNGSTLLVGFAISIQALGNTLTPFVGANLIEHRKRVLPVGFVTGSLMRLALLLFALAGLWLEGPWALVAIFAALLLFGLFSGMQGVIFNFLMSKLIPVSHRGRLTGLRQFLAGITSACVAWLAGAFILGDNPTQAGYSYTFILAFVLTSIGLAMLIAVREPEPPAVQTKATLLNRLRAVPELLREDPAFARYFYARSIANLGRLAMPFYILYAGEQIGLSGSMLGLTTFAFAAAGTLSNLVWGAIADRTGFRLTFLIGIGLWVLSTALLMLTQADWALVLVFAGVGAAAQGFHLSAVNLTLEFGQRADLPMRIAIANTGSDLAGTLGPILGGLLATYFGYLSVFWASILALVLGGWLVLKYVPEPRR